MSSLSNEKQEVPRFGRYLLAFAALMGAAFLLYHQSFFHAWTYDDFPVVVNNPDILSLADFLNNTYRGRPLREITYLFDHALFGLQPMGYHFQNIFWHGLNAFLIYLVVVRLGGSRLLAWGSALLFVVHPVLVEVVANISHRKDSLALAFSLLAILALQKFYGQQIWSRRGLWLVATIIAGLLAYSAKQSAIALLPVAVAYEWAYVSRQRRVLTRSRWLLLIGCVLFVGYGVYWYLDGGRAGYLRGAQFLFSKMSYYGPINEWTYGLMLLKSWAFMFAKTVVPVNLALEYSYPTPTSLLDPWVLSGLALLGIYLFGLWLSWRKDRRVFFCLVWIGAFWVPVSNVWPLAYFAADRYLYAPMAGVVVLLAVALFALRPRLGAICWGILFLYVGILALFSWRQNQVWRDEFSLWQQAVRVSPDSVYALNNLGALYGNRGNIRKALELIGRAAENPYYRDAQLNMARIYERFGQKERAAYYYQRAANPHAANPGE